MNRTHFTNLKPFPGAGETAGSPPAHHNQPPLEDQVTADFDDAIHAKGLDARVAEITEAAGRAPEIKGPEDAGAVGDLVAMAKAAKQAIEAEREVLNRPLLTAQRSLKGKADGLVSPMDSAVAPLRKSLDAFMAEQEDKAVAHGDLGARVSGRTAWDFEITAMAKLPLRIRQHPTVMEAIEKVIRGEIKAGARKIPGVNIWPVAKAAVR